MPETAACEHPDSSEVVPTLRQRGCWNLDGDLLRVGVTACGSLALCAETLRQRPLSGFVCWHRIGASPSFSRGASCGLRWLCSVRLARG